MFRSHSTFVTSSVLLFVLCSVVSAPVLAAEDATNTKSSATIETKVLPSGTTPLQEVMLDKQEQYEEDRSIIGERREDAMARIASGTSAARARVLARRLQLAPRIKDRVQNLFENVKARITASIDRLDNITTRLESRAKKMRDAGTDTTEADARLVDAHVALTEARAALTDASAVSLENIVDADSPSEKFDLLRVRVTAVHDALLRTHSALRAAVAALSQPAPALKESPAATTTTATSTN